MGPSVQTPTLAIGKYRRGRRQTILGEARSWRRPALVTLAILGILASADPVCAWGHEDAELLCEPVGSGYREPDPGPAVLHPVETAPASLDDGWPVSTLAAEGLDARLVDAMLGAIRDGRYEKLDGVLLARNGKLVLEAYFNGFDREAKHDTRSAFKSITSALAGIARDKGLIPTLDDPVSDYFPDYWPGIESGRAAKGRISLAHLLTMTPGFDAEENWGVGPDREEAMWHSADWVQYTLALPMAREAGARFSYNSSTTFLIGEIVARAAGDSLPIFAETHLFGPLGITDYCWTLTDKGRAVAQGSFYMRPRDMAKLGQLFLDRGLWRGRRLLSERWVEVSTRRHVDAGRPDSAEDAPSRLGYGYQWWTYRARNRVFDQYFASGNGGQKIFVFPRLALVAVFTGSSYNDPAGHRQVTEIFTRYLVPALLQSLP